MGENLRGLQRETSCTARRRRVPWKDLAAPCHICSSGCVQVGGNLVYGRERERSPQKELGRMACGGPYERPTSATPYKNSGSPNCHGPADRTACLPRPSLRWSSYTTSAAKTRSKRGSLGGGPPSAGPNLARPSDIRSQSRTSASAQAGGGARRRGLVGLQGWAWGDEDREKKAHFSLCASRSASARAP